MCGIAGAWSRSSDRSASVRAMCDALVHRGPDDEGHLTREPVSLGMRRLSIIDVAHGQQPMSNEDGTIHVVLNGELYNYAELRKRLIRAGHVLHSHSDTEVLPHLYEEHGDALVGHLRGMFAFALLDERKGCLFLARDRAGKKPLYYYERAGELIFASELKALIATGKIPRVPDMVAIHHYLMLQYVPDPWSAIAGVRKLPPASLGRYDGSSLEIRKYWSLRYEPKRNLSYGEAVEQVSDRLDEAVAMRMVGERPVGAFLSGGVDSSLVVSRMARFASGDLRTYCVGFNAPGRDERGYARTAANIFGTIHTDVTLEPTADLISLFTSSYDEPFADSSALPTLAVSRLASRDVTVALTGDGGDEAFGGYDRYRAISGMSWLALPQCAVAGVSRVTAALTAFTQPGTRARRVTRLADTIATPPGQRYMRVMAYFSGEQRDALYTAKHRAQMMEHSTDAIVESRINSAAASRMGDRLMAADVESYLPGDLLVKVDIATMRHGLEARSPFLDQGLVEFAATLPVAYKMTSREGKRVLKTLARRELPAALVDRRKSGFSVPLADWLRGALRPLCEEQLEDSWFVKQGYFDKKAVRSLIGGHMGGSDNANQLWSLLVLELWANRFLP